ncbi:hypothetical protein O181_092865 [Austropuccinia psidii MF-1]|uniref:Uncharacterized protein n=1 Tax=Austropuccinia psidii MF-1 TaxID=1389203 RepID=A0A9Q3J0K9_9BASI|nr:hypothetical protein [Austropuccinia psidii MF-1]
MEPDFKEGDQVLVSTLSFNNLKGPKEMRYSFVRPFTIIKLIGKVQWKSNSQKNVLENTQSFQLVGSSHTSRERRINSPPGRRTPHHHKYWKWSIPLDL